MLKTLKDFILDCIIRLNHVWFDVCIFFRNTFLGQHRWYLKDYDHAGRNRSFYTKINGVEYLVFYRMSGDIPELYYLYDLFWLRPLLETESEKIISDDNLIELIYKDYDTRDFYDEYNY